MAFRDKRNRFLDLAKGLFDGRPLLTVPSPRKDEERFLSVGLVDGKFFTLVWTRREAKIRLITQGGRGMRKKSNIVHYTMDGIKAKIARGESKMDWKKIDEMTEEELEASIRADPDEPREEEIDWTKAVKGIPPHVVKDHINIRIDHDVLAWFKKQGRGYQTLMNNVLRAFVQTRRASK